MRPAFPTLRLSEYVRLYKAGGRRLAQSVLDDRSVELDDAAHALLRAAAAGPAAPPELAYRVPDLAPGAVFGRLAMLRDLGFLVADEAEDRARLQAALSEPGELPALDQIELTNVCPMKCVMCPKGDGRDRRPTGFLDFGLFERVLGEIAATQRQTKSLALHNLGESLLHPELPRFVRAAAAADAGVRPELSVNPGLLPLERYQELADAGLHRLVLSLDGLDAPTLDAVRGKAARGAQALAHVETLLEHRARHPAETPVLVVQMLQLRANAHHHEEFRRRFGGRTVPGLFVFSKDLDANTDPRLLPEGKVARPYLCRAPWKTVVVLWDGRVVPCCHDARAEWVLGDLRRQSMAEIWHGEPAERLRERLRNGWPSPDGPCGSCAHRPDLWRRPSLDLLPEEPMYW